MKKLILFLYIVSKFTCYAKGQTELIIPYDGFSNYNKSLYCISHLTEEDGSVYVLASEGDFHTGYGMACTAGHWGRPIMLFKLNASGHILWQTNITSSGSARGQIFINDGSVFVPYVVEGGCEQQLRVGGMYMPTAVYAGIFVDRATGAAKSNKVFSPAGKMDKGASSYSANPCVSTSLLTVAEHKNEGISYIIQADESYRQLNADDKNGAYRQTNKIQSIDLDDTLGYRSRTPVGVSSHSSPLIVHDAANEEYVVADSGGINIYERNFNFKRSFSLPHISTRYYPEVKIAMNSEYYVVNYGYKHYSQQKREDTFYTVVFTKKGELVSEKITPGFCDITISENRIYGLTAGSKDFRDSTLKPLTVIAYDTRLKVVKEKKFGKPYVSGSCISAAKNNEIIVTGTSNTWRKKEGEQSPNRIYYCRLKL